MKERSTISKQHLERNFKKSSNACQSKRKKMQQPIMKKIEKNIKLL